MSAVNVEVELRPGESSDKLIKRFFKKVKKTEIIKEYLEKTAYAKTKSQKKRDKRLKNRNLRRIEKLKAERRANRDR